MAHAHYMLGTQVYKHTHSEYVTFTAFSLQQLLHERAYMLCFTYILYLIFVTYRQEVMTVDQKP